MPINERVPEEDRVFYGALYCSDWSLVFQELEDNTITACITDPPYGVSHLGNTWDKDVPKKDVWEEVYRVLKPGGYVVSATAPSKYHLAAAEIEAAGFEIRDMMIWHYTQSAPGPCQSVDGGGEWRSKAKPNHEPWVVARKPIEKGLTLKQNWEKWRTGGVLVGEAGAEKWNTNFAKVDKPSRTERDSGLQHRVAKITAGTESESKRKRKGAAFNVGMGKNNHPTVKPLSFMRRLIRMYAVPGSAIIDPFMGSGTTGMAAVADGYVFFGAEIDEDHFEKAEERIMWAASNPEEIPLAE